MKWKENDNPGAFGDITPATPYAQARFAVLPLPFDGTSTWLKGTDAGPDAVLAASANMELYDVETDSEPWRKGIVTMAPVAAQDSPEAMVAAVREVALDLIGDGKAVVGVGGEHTVSVGLIQAHREHYPGLTVLQLDAHADTRDEYGGSRYSHACVMARVAEICDYVQVGVRSMDAAEKGKLNRRRTFFAHEITRNVAWVDDVVALLNGPVYVTVDLDVLDPGEMPSTGTPEPGGLSYREITKLLAAVCREQRVVGFDVVELMPNAHNKAPDFLAARLIYQMMAYMNEW